MTGGVHAVLTAGFSLINSTATMLRHPQQHPWQPKPSCAPPPDQQGSKQSWFNTRPIVQRNLAAGTAQLQQDCAPYAAAVSPGGKLNAWSDCAAVVVQDWCSRFLVAAAQLPAGLFHVGSLHWSSTNSHLALAVTAEGYQAALVLDISSGLPPKKNKNRLWGTVRQSAAELTWAPSSLLLAVICNSGVQPSTL